MITDWQSTQLWYVIEEMVQAGVTPAEFKREAAASWEQALRERLANEPKEIMQ